jgi:hypothetical protein
MGAPQVNATEYAKEAAAVAECDATKHTKESAWAHLVQSVRHLVEFGRQGELPTVAALDGLDKALAIHDDVHAEAPREA